MVPQPMGASHGQGGTAVRAAIDALQKALPNLPMGSELWAAVHKALGDIGKHLDMAGGKDPAAMAQMMMAMMRDAKIDPQRRAFMQSFPTPMGGGGGPPAGGGGGPPPGISPPAPGGGGNPLAGLLAG